MPIPDKVDNDLALRPVISVEHSIIPCAKFERTLPLGGQCLGLERLKILGRPPRSLERTLGYGSIQPGQTALAAKCERHLLHYQVSSSLFAASCTGIVSPSASTVVRER